MGEAVSVTGTTYAFSISEAGDYSFGVKSVGSDALESAEVRSNSLTFFKVTFDTNGGGQAATQIVPSGGSAAQPTDPQKNGFTFAGWYSDIDLSTPWDFVAGTVSQNMTLYAKWEAGSYTVTVQIEGNGTAFASPASAAEGTTISLTATADGGYHFKEWQVISGSVTISGDAFTMPAEDVTVKAVFEQDETPPDPEHVHAWSSAWSTDGAHHWHECLAEGCGITADSEKDGYGAHIYDDAQDTDCNVCGHVRGVTPPDPEHVHAWSSAWSTDGTHHWHECLAEGCGITADSEKNGYGAHVYDDEQDTDCNVCGHVREVTPPDPEHVHAWSSAWSTDGTHHWHECLAEGCGITADSEKNGYGVHVYDDEQDTDCNVCGHIREVTPPDPEHVHDWSSTWSTDGTHHWHECLAEGCGITADSEKDGYGVHIYDDGQDTTCNICGHVREVTPPEQPGDEETKIEIEEGITEAPPVFTEIEHLNTPEKITQVMRTALTQIGVPSGNTAVYDVTLLVSTDGGMTWTPATKDNFPAGGLTVTLPYPAGTNSRYTFTVVHMFTTSDFGKTPGDTETPHVTNTADGLRFTVTGLSPISVGWTRPSSSGGGSGGSGSSSGGGGGWSTSSTYAVTVERTEHGKVTSNRSNASSGSTVTLTAAPDSGYVLDILTVTDSRGSEIRLTAQGSGTYTFTMPGRAATVKAVFAPLPEDTEKPCDGGADCPSRGFTDLGTAGTWYHEAVDYVLRNHLMGGYGNGLFGPNDNLSRAQFVQILFNNEGRPVVNYLLRYNDVADGAWYTEAIRWAASQGIAGGYGNGVFGPNDNITREQLAVMLWRYAGSPAATGRELQFTDADKAGGHARVALCWAVENGILNGYGDGRLNPGGVATRAQAAQMLMNFLKSR